MARSSIPYIPEINVSSCCCCFSIRTGCLILGYLGFISCMIGHFATGIFVVLIIKGKEDLSSDEFKYTFPILCFLFVVFSLMSIVYYLLIRGVNKKKPKLMFPWIYITLVTLVLSGLSAIATIVMAVRASPVDGPLITSSIIQIIVQTALGLHFLMVVTSYCQQLLAEQNNECNNGQAMQTVMPESIPPL